AAKARVGLVQVHRRLAACAWAIAPSEAAATSRAARLRRTVFTLMAFSCAFVFWLPPAARIAGRVRRGSGVTATGGEGTAGLLDAPLGAGEPFTELSRLNRPRTTRQTGQELIEGGIQPRPQGRRQHRALVFPGNLGITGIHALQQLLGLEGAEHRFECVVQRQQMGRTAA